MPVAMLLFIATLFVLLTPGILLTLPPNGSKLIVAIVHGTVFALTYNFLYKAVWRLLYEGFQSPSAASIAQQQTMVDSTAAGLAVGIGFNPTSFNTARGPGTT